MPTIADLLRNPEFRKLPRGAQLIGLRETDSEFGKLSDGAQLAALDDPDFLPSVEPPQPTLPGKDLREGKRKTTITEDIAQSYKGTIGEAIAPEAARKTADYAARFVGATGESIASIATNLGNIVHALGSVTGFDTLRDAGGGLASVGKTVEREFKPEKTGGEGVMGQLPEIAGSAVGSMLGFRGAGKLVGKAVEKIAGTGKAGAIANWLATSAVETGTSAGGVYEEELQAGKDAGTAAGSAAKFAAFSGPATAGLNKLGQFNDRIRNPITRIVADLGGEIAQEDSEQLIQNMVTGKPWNAGLPEATVGAVFGSLIGGSAFEHAAVTGIVNDYHEAVKEHGASSETARQVMERRLTEEAPHTAALTSTVRDGNFDPLTEMTGILQGRKQERDAAVNEFLAEHPEYREEVLGKDGVEQPADLAGALPYTPKVGSQEAAAVPSETTADAPVEGPGPGAAPVAAPAAEVLQNVDPDNRSIGSGEQSTSDTSSTDTVSIANPAQPDNRTKAAAEASETQNSDAEKLYRQAVDAVRSNGKASPAFLQRNFGVKYSTAKQLLQRMEAEGIVGAANGADTRKLLAGKPDTPQVKFSSTQVNLPKDLANEVREQAAAIAEEDLAAEGRENEPHVTVKYGLHSDDAEHVRKLLADEPPVRVHLGKTSLFENTPDGDVVKVDVNSPDLHRLNAKIAGAVENTTTFSEYKPHVTLGYVKPGRGKKYAGNAALEGREVVVDRVVFSDRQGNKTEIVLGGKSTPVEKAAEISPLLAEVASEVQQTLPTLKQKPFAEAVAAHGRWKAKLLDAHKAGVKVDPFIVTMVDRHAGVLRKQLGEKYAGPLTAEEILRKQQALKQASQHVTVWEIPPDVYADSEGAFVGDERARILAKHRETVKAALEDGKPVPADVLEGHGIKPTVAATNTPVAKRPVSARRKETSGGVASADLLASPVLRGVELLGAGVRTFREWKARLIAEYGPSIKHKAYSLWAAAKRLWNDETGTLRLDKLAEWYRDSTPKAFWEATKAVETRIRQAGNGAGRELMDLVERAEHEGHVLAGMLLVKLRDAKIANLKREERFELMDALEGRISPDKLKDNVREVYAAARSISDEIAVIADDLDVMIQTKDGKRKFAGRKDYFPHVIHSPKLLKKGQIRNDVLENMVRIKAAANAEEATVMLDNFLAGLESNKWENRVLDWLIRTGQADNRADALAKMQRYRKSLTTKEGSLEHAREVSLPFYDPDPARVLPTQTFSKAMRLAQIAELGQGNARLNAEILKIRDAGGNEEFVRNHIKRILGEDLGTDEEANKVIKFLGGVQVMKMSLSAVKNSSQQLNIALAGDFPALAVGVGSLFSARGRRLAIESGAALDPVLNEALRHMGNTRFAQGLLKAYGFTLAEQANRISAANAGVYVARKLLRKAKKGDKAAAERMREVFGIDAAAAIERGGLSHGDLLMAAKRFSDYTQFRINAAKQPAFTEHWLGRAVFIFKSFAYNQARFLARETIGEFKRGHLGRGTRNLLIVGGVYSVVGDLIRQFLNWLKGRDDEEFESGLTRWIMGVMEIGTLGWWADLILSARQHRLLANLAGPAIKDASDLAELLASDKDVDEKLNALKKFAVKRAPFGAVLPRLIPALAE